MKSVLSCLLLFVSSAASAGGFVGTASVEPGADYSIAADQVLAAVSPGNDQDVSAILPEIESQANSMFEMDAYSLAGLRSSFKSMGRSLYSYEQAQSQAQYWAQKKCGSKKAQRVSGWQLKYDVNYHDGNCDDEPRYCAPTVIPEYSAQAQFICK